MHDVLLVPGFGGTEAQPLLTKIAKALVENGLAAKAITLTKHRPQPSLAKETEELRAFFHALTNGKGAIVGRSFGGRVAVRLAAHEPVRAMVLLGFPVRPPGKTRPEDERALQALMCPTLILQGENDELGDPELLREICAENHNVVIETIAGAKHSYGKTEKIVIARTAEWLRTHARTNVT